MARSEPRPLVAAGPRLAIAAPHEAATEAGLAAFDRGGSAVDAALTACAVLAVVYPHMCSIGGDLFALLHPPSGQVVAVNGSGAAPAGIDVDLVRGRSSRMPLTGPDTITVPGVLAAWEDLRRLGGRLTLAEILRPALAFADEGFAVSPSLARALAAGHEALLRDPGAGSVFSPQGRVPEEGTMIRQPALAHTLQEIADGGVETFYGGALGERFTAGLRALGSAMTPADLGAHATDRTDPLVGTYRGWEIFTTPPNSQGFVLAEILLALEELGVEPNALGNDAPLMARVFALASRDRDRLLADPRWEPVPVDELLGAEHIASLAREASEGPRRPGTTGGSGDGPVHGDTIAVAAADGEGWGVSIIQSVFHAFGSGILEPETGILCQNRGACFTLDPSSPNVLAGGKRPAHTLMPVMVRHDGALRVVAGTMGGRAQPQIHSQVLGRLFGGSWDLLGALSEPRWVVGALEAGGRSDAIFAEPAALDRCGEQLARAGMEVVGLGELDEEVGHAQYLLIGSDGVLSSASDPRADGSAGAR